MMRIAGPLIPGWGCEYVILVVMRVLALAVLHRLNHMGVTPVFAKPVSSRRGQIVELQSLINEQLNSADSSVPADVRSRLKKICELLSSRVMLMYTATANELSSARV